MYDMYKHINEAKIVNLDSGEEQSLETGTDHTVPLKIPLC